jgi:hypothetical protein
MAVYVNYIDAAQLADFQLFLSLIRADVPVERIGRFPADGRDIDWRRIAYLADRHRVLSILYFNLRKLDLRQQLPEDICNSLRARYLQVTGGNMRLWQRLVELVDLLESRGVPVVPFKGPVLANSLYGDSALRYYQDIDLLVPQKAAVKAWAALRAAGYRSMELALREGQFARYVSFEKEFDFIDDAGNTLIDLQWRLTMHTRYPYDYEFCRDRLTTMAFNRRKVSCLSDEDMVLYLCIHGGADLWVNVGAILCLAELIAQRPNLDWEVVLDLAAVMHCRRMVWLGLFLARDLFDVALPEKIIEVMENDGELAGLVEVVYGNLFQARPQVSHFNRRLGEIPFHLKIRDKWPAKVRYLFLMMFWPTKKDWRNLPLPPRLAFLYFLLRPMALGAECISAKLFLPGRD